MTRNGIEVMTEEKTGCIAVPASVKLYAVSFRRYFCFTHSVATISVCVRIDWVVIFTFILPFICIYENI